MEKYTKADLELMLDETIDHIAHGIDFNRKKYEETGDASFAHGAWCLASALQDLVPFARTRKDAQHDYFDQVERIVKEGIDDGHTCTTQEETNNVLPH